MGQRFFEDSIGTVTHSSGVLTLSASRITIGGQQYNISSASYTITGLSASTKYNLFAVVSGGTVVLVPSTNAITLGPAGYPQFVYLRSFLTTSGSSFAAFSAAIADPNPVGTIIQSMLTLAQFQSLFGTTWVLADGSSVAGSMYAAITGNANIPDARGLVLRGKNNGRSDGNQNPAGDLSLGTFQDHAFQTHGHSATSSDSGHGHSIPGANTNVTGTGFAKQSVTDSNNATNTGYANITTTVGNPNSGNTSTETRMRNITVNTFIKINME